MRSFPVILLIVVLLVLAVIFIFEVWMFIDVIKNKNINDERRLLWAIGMILLHPFVAIAYYFTDHKLQAGKQ